MFSLKLACPRHFHPEHGNFAKISAQTFSQQSARNLASFRHFQSKVADLGCFGQNCVFGRFWTKVSGRCPGGVREASGRRPGGVREASGRRPGRVRRRCKWEKFQEFGRTTPKSGFFKKKTETKKNGFCGAPIKCQKRQKPDFLGFRPLKKKTQKHKKTGSVILPCRSAQKHPKTGFFLAFAHTQPKKRFFSLSR